MDEAHEVDALAEALGKLTNEDRKPPKLELKSPSEDLKVCIFGFNSTLSYDY